MRIKKLTIGEVSLNDQFNEEVQTTLNMDQDKSAKKQDFFEDNNVIEIKRRLLNLTQRQK